ncbi:MAG: Plasmid stabilization system [Candidatus Roizmanbacteria bacterium GW2011_GWC2_37_13]|uniref:Plasmid stabilization system n=1 Tax=Candidatus Roizmanbacteria bacterium GW2011_GWC2_37_13 TaxID=1618486 RepID=A0A0G0JCS4_9BACT|nr:MAG: Plasmid stabilization system [Candidatus Roizmanbacteria bacterium GW2011_GWC2_37_13]
MKVTFHKHFVKNFDKRIKTNSNLLERFNSKYELFLKDKNDPLLHCHRLTGTMKEKQSFSITGDIRVIFQESEDTIEFLDIGTHNQVYK